MTIYRSEPKPVDIHVGQQLRTLRLSRGYSQERLGEAVGLTFQQIQKYEKGRNRIGASRLYEFATILGCEPGYFFEGLNQGKVIERPEVAALSNKENVRMLLAFDKLLPDEPVKRKLLALTEALVE